MQSFLNNSGLISHGKLLEFWKDVRQYLDADESHRDEFGNIIKSRLAHHILKQYLSTTSESILPEKVKMTVLASLSYGDDSSVFILTQDIITEVRVFWLH